MSKPYVRLGRRFVPVPDYTGYFYDKNYFYENGGLFKEKTKHSFAIVVSQNGDVATLASLQKSIEKMTWDEAKDYCNHFWIPSHMPSLVETLQAVEFNEHLQFKYEDAEWISTEYYDNLALRLRWGGSETVVCYHKDSLYYVRPFFKLNVLTGEYV